MDKLQADKLTEIREIHNQTTDGEWIADGFGTVYSESTNTIIAEVFDNDDAEFIAKSQAYITYLLQLVETQAQALEFYADEETYEQQWKDHGYWADPEIDDDRGQRAREAIKLTQV